MRRLAHLGILLVLALLAGNGSAATTACTWQLTGARAAGEFDAISARSDQDVWAVGFSGGDFGTKIGHPVAAHWDGRRWNLTPTPVPASELADVVTLAPDDAWAVGADRTHTLVEHWDGRSWRRVTTPYHGIGSLTVVAAVSSNDVWVGGSRLTAVDRDGPGGPLLEHWDGRSWRVVAPPANASTLSVDNRGDVWTPCGARTRTARGYAGRGAPCRNGRTIAARTQADVWVSDSQGLHRWNGAMWSPATAQIPGALSGDVAVLALAAVGRNQVWAAGYLTQGGDSEYERLWLFDGSAWREIEGALPSGEWTAVTDLDALGGNDVWAAARTESGARVERWTCRA